MQRISCQCEPCRKFTGALHVHGFIVDDSQVAWAAVPEGAEGALKLFRSSSHGQRGFCTGCGGSLMFRSSKSIPGATFLFAGGLDDGALAKHPELVKADVHVYAGNAIEGVSDRMLGGIKYTKMRDSEQIM